MTDLASLGLAIDSAPAVAASAALDKMASSAKTAGQATDALNASSTKSTSAVQSAATAAQQAAVGLGSHTKAVNDNSAAHKANADAVGLSYVQVQEFTHITKSLIDQVVAGQSPLRALTVEGGRIAQAFNSNAGGAGGTLKALGSTLSSILTPARLAAGGLLSLGAAAVYAFAEYEAGQKKLEASTQGIGRYSGLTLGGLNNVAIQGAAAGNISASSGRDLAGQFNATGRIGGGLNTQLIGSAKTFARVTGQDLGDAGDEFAKAFSDPAKGADLLNEKLGFLDDKTKQLVVTQSAALNVMGAQSTLFAAYNADLATAIDHTSALAKVWDTAKTSASNFFSRLGEGVAQKVMPTDEYQLQQLTDQRNALDHSRGWGVQSKRADLDAQIAPLQARVDAAMAKAQEDARQVAANRLSISGGDIVRSTLPDIGRRQELEDNASGLGKLQADQLAMSKLSDAARGEVGHALDNVTEKLSHFATAAQVVAQNSDFAVRSTLARTLADRVSIESQRSYAEVIRSTGDKTLAAATAEAKRNEMIASGTRNLLDYSRDISNQHALVGLNPYDRTIAENKQRFDQLTKDNAVTDGATAATVRFTTAISGATNALMGKPANSNLPAFASGMPQGDIAAMIQASSAKYGIDPATAIRVAQSEGGLTPGRIGDNGSSFGPFQLHYGGIAGGGNSVAGMGDDYTRATGFRAGDGVHTQQEIDFALANVSKNGWSAFHGAAGAGIGNMDGISGSSSATVSNAAAAAGARASLAQQNYDSTTGQFIDAIGNSNRALETQTATLKLQNATAGQTPEVIAGMTAQQNLLNEAYLRGSTSSLDFAKQTDELQQKLRSAGVAAAAFAKQQQDLQNRIEGADLARNGLSGGLHTVADDLEQGKGRDIPRDLAKGAINKAIDVGISGITGALLGKSGSPLGGLLGGLIPGLGGAAGALSTANVTAGVVNVIGADGIVGAATSAVTGGGGGIIGSILSGIGSLFAFADGGIMGSGGPISLRKYAAGGVANTPQLAMFGEGGMPEAYVPLADGRTIPVTMQGGSFGGGGQGGDYIAGDNHFHFTMNNHQTPRETMRHIKDNIVDVGRMLAYATPRNPSMRVRD